MVKGARKRRCTMTSTAPDSGALGVMSRCEAALVLSFLCVLPHRLDRFTGEDRQSIPKAFPVKHGKTLPDPPSHSRKISETKLMKESLLISQAIAAPILPIYFIGGKCPGLLIHTQSSFGQIFSSNDLTCLLGSIIHHFSLEKVNSLTCMTKAPPPRGFSGYRKFLERLMRNEIAYRPIDRRRKRGQVLWVQRRRCGAFRHPERSRGIFLALRSVSHRHWQGNGVLVPCISAFIHASFIGLQGRFLASLEMTIRESPSH